MFLKDAHEYHMSYEYQNFKREQIFFAFVFGHQVLVGLGFFWFFFFWDMNLGLEMI